jgi:hypothetical protein
MINFAGTGFQYKIREAIEARTSMVDLAVSFFKPVWGQFNLQVKTTI